MDNSGPILIAAVSAAIVAVLAAVSTLVIKLRDSKTKASKEDVATLEGSYKKLQKTYEDANARLNIEIGEERNARRADRLECERQIAALREQVLELTRKLPEPGAIVKMVIAGIDTDALPALPVKLTGVQADVILPTEILRPDPLRVMAAQAAAAQAAAAQAAAAT